MTNKKNLEGIKPAVLISFIKRKMKKQIGQEMKEEHAAYICEEFYNMAYADKEYDSRRLALSLSFVLIDASINDFLPLFTEAAKEYVPAAYEEKREVLAKRNAIVDFVSLLLAFMEDAWYAEYFNIEKIKIIDEIYSESKNLIIEALQLLGRDYRKALLESFLETDEHNAAVIKNEEVITFLQDELQKLKK